MRHRPFYSFGIWCTALVAATGFMAWKFGWLPIELSSPETGTLVKAETSDKPVDSSATGQAGGEKAADVSDTDAVIFAAQSEPSLEPDLKPAPAAAGSPRSTRNAAWNDLFESTAGLAPRRAGSGRSGPRSQPAVRDSSDGRFTPPPRDDRIAPASLQIDDRDLRRASPRPLPRSIPSDEFGGAAVERPERPRPTILQVAGQEEPAAEPRSAGDRLAAIDEAIAGGQYLAAHKELSRIYWKEPALRPTIQERIDRVAKIIYFSPQPHFMEPYTVEPGDQLRKVAGQYRVPWQYLARLNQVDPARIRGGQKLKVIKGPFSAFVDLSDFELIVHAHGYYVKRYHVGIGKDGASPVGKFKVLTKVANPQYTDPEGRVVEGDDPANPLGERWLDLGNSYGIHGTIEPDSIGKAESRGCIRLLNSDVEEVYDLLDIGSEVIIRP